MRNLKIALAVLTTSVLATTANSGMWPEVGDQFRRDDGTLLVVAKIKAHGNVCLRKSGGRAKNKSCAWAKVDDLHGDWITFAGVPQKPASASESSANAAEKFVRMPEYFINEWCSDGQPPREEKGSSVAGYKTPSWTDGPCTNIFVINPWGFYGEELPGCNPIKVRIYSEGRCPLPSK